MTNRIKIFIEKKIPLATPKMEFLNRIQQKLNGML